VEHSNTFLLPSTPQRVQQSHSYSPERTSPLSTAYSFHYLIEFHHSPGNHTVSQSSFSNPCGMLEGGFDSGYIVIPPGLTSGFPTFNLTITNASIREFCLNATKLSDGDLRPSVAFDSYLDSLQAACACSSLYSWHGCVSQTIIRIFLDVTCIWCVSSGINVASTGPNSFDAFRTAAMATTGSPDVRRSPLLTLKAT
jgi:hypothetical protein